ncbi:putative ribose/galactose/methyl galactoside import ATP-binding protein 1 [Luteimicrobium album]|uniref:Ribose/galactose/methyl galactoside import ATP-binding protein 1 n=1 Tax=Luteimicrobium album TaxID=1054550 RepID=A0ABQ6I2D0_9MICO|nr:sugar ABC transporter ATP-binding protein [Luteimicrobium album]GMA24421.1 putative ribose/galactose/methyl galactoside import ATP-binding protein 1 [Luteimicrobium album]
MNTLLEFHGVAKAFPGVRALEDVTFRLDAGEVCALAGENGAGKSTLLGILGGSHAPDAGSLTIAGSRRTVHTPRQALADGVQIAQQEPAVVPLLTVDQNLQLGLSRAERRELAPRTGRAYEDLRAMGFPLAPDAKVIELSPAERQALGVVRALARATRVVALDEPTTSMVESNVDRVLECIRKAAVERSLGVLYVSHRMREVMTVADSVVVLRDGAVNLRSAIDQTDEHTIVERMVGRQILQFSRESSVRPGASPVMRVRDAVHPRGNRPISLEVAPGEVLGIAGLVGSGRTELLRSIVHADDGARSTVEIEGRPVHLRNPRDARSAGIAFVPEDRKKQGLVLGAPTYLNVVMTAGGEFSRLGFVRRRSERLAARAVTERLALSPRDVTLAARQFSGGNQQKVVVAKWVWRDSAVYLFDEPTKGVDVGGKVEIYQAIDRLAADGKGVVVVSSELPELIALCDRVLVMREGAVVAEHVKDSINEEDLVRSAMGLTKDGK